MFVYVYIYLYISLYEKFFTGFNFNNAIQSYTNIAM